MLLAELIYTDTVKCLIDNSPFARFQFVKIVVHLENDLPRNRAIGVEFGDCKFRVFHPEGDIEIVLLLQWLVMPLIPRFTLESVFKTRVNMIYMNEIVSILGNVGGGILNY